MRTLLHISSYILIAMISNALVVLSIGSFLGDLIYFRDGRVLYLTVIRADPLYDFIVNASLFPVALIFILFYLAPIRHLYNDTASDSSAYRRGVRRMLNAPLAISAVAIVGWIAGNAMMYMIYYYEGIHIGAFYIFTNMITMVILSLLTFVFCFYLMDYLNRRVYIPRIFPGGSPVDFEGGIRTGLRFRLEVFVAAVSLAPILILAQAALNLMLSEKDEIKTSVPVIVGVSLGLIILSQVFSVLLARYLRHPIARMRGAVNRIEQLDFNVHIPITANDEIAQLANGINNMAAGLREKEIIKEKFGRAVDPRVRDFLLNQSIEPGGEEKDVTVLFADIRGFTTFSEGRAPSEVVAWLNRFFEEMSGAIEAHGGLVNKYIGDAILAVFNAPLPLADHPRHAVEAAQEMLERLEKLNQQVEQSDTATIRIGIGIETGTAMVGNIGSQNRLEYTVIGDAVNTASRVESLCKRFDCSLLITERVARAIENTHTATKVARGKVKGKQSTVTVYTL